MTEQTSIISNGSSTLSLDTTNYNTGNYSIQAQTVQTDKYKASNTSTTELTLQEYYHYGMDTNNPFTSTMWSNGTETNGVAISNYTKTLNIFQHCFNSDFTIKAYLNCDCIQNPGRFGFTKSNTSISEDFGTIYDSSVFPTPNTSDTLDKLEVISLKRRGTTYTISKGDTIIKTSSVSSVEPVYFYMQKGGSCTIITGRLDLSEPYNGA